MSPATLLSTKAPLVPADTIYVRDLVLRTSQAGLDTWHRDKKVQPLLANVWVRAPVALAGKSDLVSESVHYGILSKAITEAVENDSEGKDDKFANDSLELAKKAVNACFNVGAEYVKLRLTFPKKLLRADAAGVEITRHRFTPYGANETVESVHHDKAFIEGLRVYTVIGLNPWERLEKQEVVVAVEVDANADIVKVADELVKVIEKSAYLTIEALVSELARLLIVDHGFSNAKVRAEKPRAIAFAACPGVEISRSKRYYSTKPSLLSSSPVASSSSSHVAYLGMGSNLGERARLLVVAVEELEKRQIKVLRTSSMYESAPMYVEDQPKFLNAVCQVQTTLSPRELLATVQDIEKNALGRVKLIEKGPRTIDLDILLYDNTTVRDGTILSVPHLLMLEREFVLRPLKEIAGEYVHPVTTIPVANHFDRLMTDQDTELVSVVPIKRDTFAPGHLTIDTIRHEATPTFIMAILNVTPDSFSDGGKHLSLDAILESARSFVRDGATLIDIGGQSTNPKSQDPGPAEEQARVIPAIKLLRRYSEFDNIVISIDTYYASVARAAVEAGADIVNDVSAGMLDSDMLSTVAELEVPIILMHMRGTPQTMAKQIKYENDDVVAGVAAELSARVREAEQAGIKRWNIILDPGFGFAKTVKQNLQLLRGFAKLRQARPEFEGLPWLIGTSRKGFVGKITGVDQAGERAWGTGATVVSAIAEGGDIVRVHDVKEMVEVTKMADAIYKSI
ncbi:Dihydropteroate synthase-like protein [Lipomyces japonicus]|uniref:Dihydropteroate synthase-like protein n=1 Tax=Lipomyces japonicus TaxID=56871 RepID=UPI0034CFDE04